MKTNDLENEVSYLQKVKEYVQKGIYINYEFVNQADNGYAFEVESGDMPLITYSFNIYMHNVYTPAQQFSVDTLEEGFAQAFHLIENYAEELDALTTKN